MFLRLCATPPTKSAVAQTICHDVTAMKLVGHSSTFSTSSVIAASDARQLKALGVNTIIDNRMETQSVPLIPSVSDIRTAAVDAGIAFHHYPVSSANLTKEIGREYSNLLSSCQPPVLALCNSGNSATKLYMISKSLSAL